MIDKQYFVDNNRVFTKTEVETILKKAKKHTLLEVDKNNVFRVADANPDKVTRGIAGDVIELSVLGCKKRDPLQAPDILVDSVLTELKTTGLRKPKPRGKNAGKPYEAKEPLTITAVSPQNIIHETFENSAFFEKIEHILFVFYQFLLTRSAKNTMEYADFPILGHMFWEIPDNDIIRLKNDWEVVRDFYIEVANGNKTDSDFSAEKKKLLLINTNSHASRRFRFKREFVDTIVDSFTKKELSPLPEAITCIDDVYRKCHFFSQQFMGKSLGEIAASLGIRIHGKDSCQKLIIKMFGSDAKSLNKIKDFHEMGILAKTIILNSQHKKTEDMKLMKVDFDEWFDMNTSFYAPEDELDLNEHSASTVQEFFDQTFLCIVFEEPYKPRGKKKIPLKDCVFQGFKHFSFSEQFIDNNVQSVWDTSRDLVFNHTLIEEKRGRGFAPSFPKSKESIVFLRGSGATSADRKPRLLEWGIDINMYIQYLWIRGDYIVNELSKIEYL